MDEAQLQLIRENPIGKGLDNFRDSFRSMCNDKNIRPSSEAFDVFDTADLKILSLDLFTGLHKLRVPHMLSFNRGETLFDDLWRLVSAILNDNFYLDHLRPLFKIVFTNEGNDNLIWSQVYSLVVQSTPPPRAIPSSILQTPLSLNTSYLLNTTERRHDVDSNLKLALGEMYVGLVDFYKAFFGDVPNLESVSEAVFCQCNEGDNPLFHEGWSEWPAVAEQDDVLAWFTALLPKLEALADDRMLAPATRRKLLAQPNTPLHGSTGKRSMDVGFVNSNLTCNDFAGNKKYRWSHILVVGELKKNPKADAASVAWADIARYTRKVFASQDRRRFVLGFTLCGSLMRVWVFDRLGGIASDQFDINSREGGLRFVNVILGFLFMSEELLGFDPTIMTSHGEQYIQIERDGKVERLVLDKVIYRSHCIAGRATTCWKAHRKGDPKTPLVIKDSWQYVERDEEGDFLRELTEKGVANVARYYYHETVLVGGSKDDITTNIRKGLDVTKATNYRSGGATFPPSASSSNVSHKGRTRSTGVKGRSSGIMVAPPARKPSASSSNVSHLGRSRSTGVKGRSSGIIVAIPARKPSASSYNSSHNVRNSSSTGVKRRSSGIDVALPPRKRSRSVRPVNASVEPLPNRVHRRVILCDYGKPIYKASSRVALLAAMEGCIEGHRSLYKEGFLHRDISINNLLINEDDNNTSPKSFIIDLDLTIKKARLEASGAKGMTGTRAFMAIGALLGKRHSFMHDLESFFWVLFWICIHFDKQVQGKMHERVVDQFEKWNYLDAMTLAIEKNGVISDESLFLMIAEENFTKWHQPLVVWMNRLRRKVFSDNAEKEDLRLYDSMKEVLRDAQKDPMVME